MKRIENGEWRMAEGLKPRARICHSPSSILHPRLLLLVLTGCGYTMTGDRHTLYRADVQTVAVPVFSNRTFRRGIEERLTKAVVQQMEVHSPYKVVDRDHADTILECEIVNAQTNTLSNDIETGLPQEQLYTIVVRFTWKDLRTGTILRQRNNFDERASYFQTLGESSDVGASDAINKLAVAIVQELQADW